MIERPPRPHGITATDDLLGRVLDELEGLRDDMSEHFARAFPGSPAPDPVQDPPADSPVTVNIQEPAETPATPRKRAAKKTPPASKES